MAHLSRQEDWPHFRDQMNPIVYTLVANSRQRRELDDGRSANSNCRILGPMEPPKVRGTTGRLNT